MSRWVRLWADMPTDPKFRAIARRSGRPLSEVMSLFIIMMTGADQETGALSGWSDDDAAAAMDVDETAVSAIREAMQGKVLDGLSLTGWERRQPKRADDLSTNRVREWRDRKRAEAQRRDETTVTHASERTETQLQRTETQRNAPDTETETDNRNSDPSDLHSCPNPAPKRGRASYPDDFENFWKAYPTDPNMSKKEAHAAWKRMAPEDRQRATAAVPAFREYCAGKPDYRPVHACRFLTQQRYEGFAQTPSSNNQTSAPPEAWMPSDEELRARYARTTHEQAVSTSGSDAGATATNVSRQGHEVHRDHEGVGQRPLRLDRDGPARVGELGSLLVGALRKASGPDARGEIWNEEGFHLPNEMAGMVRQ